MGQPDRPFLVWSLLLAGCVTLGVGCSTTGGSRFRTAAGSRSMATVGDQALPPTVGASGEQVAADEPEPEPRRDPKARISGRVVDPQGRPIAGATVRLADGSSQGGREVRTTTDASGAFTLGGLRPGSGYLLIAEANFGDERGTLIGRAEADTADTRVQIRLGGGEAEPDGGEVVGSKPRSRRVQSISDRTGRPSTVNDEDIGPLVDPSDADQSPRPGSRGARPDQSEGSSGWHRPGANPAAGDDQPDATLSPVQARRNAADAEGGIDSGRGGTARGSEDDEVDPLPPSLPARADPGTDRRRTTPRSRPQRAPTARVVDDPPPPAEPESEAAPPGNLSLSAQDAAPDDATAGGTGLKPMPSFAVADAPTQLGPTAEVPNLPGSPPPDEPIPGAVAAVAVPAPAPMVPGVVVSAATEPANGPAAPPIAPAVPSPNASRASYDPFALVAAAPPEPAGAGPTSSASHGQSAPASDPALPDIPPRPAAASVAADPAASAGAGPDRTRKWGDLAASSAGAATVGGDSARRANGNSTPARPASRPGVLLARRSRAADPTPADAPAESRFDSRSNQLIDFQLPGLDGKAVRFKDLDADLVLLDFWGTWCDPCVKSIPHLVDLQKKYGPDKLKVVGIACEESNPTKRRAAVAAAAEKLGINYSVLLSGKDGDCPVQRDFRVQFYPTMILLNRQGKILTRIQGATSDTLLRLDNAIESAANGPQTARR